MAAENFSDSPAKSEYDAVVIGSGPNGLAAAIELARKGASVLVIEAKDTPGGGTRSLELTEPGFVHDVCSAIHPMGVASPFMSSLPLAEHGCEWIQPRFPAAQPIDGDRAVIQEREIAATAERLGLKDGKSYRRIFEPLVKSAPKLYQQLLGPISFPRYPFAMARFGLKALRSARGFAHSNFKTEEARALFSGHAAHSVQRLEDTATAAIGLMLTVTAHHVGWPVAKGGSGKIAEAMVSILQSHGGEVVCSRPVDSIEQLPKAKAYLFDTSPTAMGQICGDRLPAGYRKKLDKYRFGPGVFKVDWALNSPIPWRNAECAEAGTVHVGGTFDEVAEAEAAPWSGRNSEKPFLILAQPTNFDPSRAPDGKHVAWAYCHVPNGSEENMLEAVESQIERFAPGFRDCVLARHTFSTAQMQAYNSNYIGGDVVGGVADLRQLFTRPVARLNPYTTPASDIFICSASTPPGAGVHGQCGFHAAKAAAKRLR
ncbi:MAG: phytoene dehydrogenase-like protein [Verrucomicrobiales bacterium]